MVSAAEILRAKVLIVDDQAVNVLLLERTLGNAGYTHITTTTDSSAVYELHRQQRFALILLDLQMPSVNGFEVMERLKEIETDSYLPVLVLPAHPEHKLRALNAGAKDFLSKPFDSATILLRVRSMLEVRLLHDKTRRRAKLLEAQALHDPLTGLANRRLLDDRLAMALIHARRNRTAMAILFLDLDDFKQINDTHGHDVGDALLTQVSARLVATVHEEDTFARVGGDEFVIVLGNTHGSDQIAAIATKLIEAVAQPYVIGGNTIGITACAGIRRYPEHGNDATGLVKSADTALYAAKRAGKNGYQFAPAKVGAAAPS